MNRSSPHDSSPLRGILTYFSNHRWLDVLLVLALVPWILFPQEQLTPFLMALIPLLWIFRWYHFGFSWRSTPLNVPLLLLAFMLLVSLGATYDIRLSFPKVCGVYYGIALCITLAYALRTSREIRVATGLLVSGGFAVAILGLLGTRWVAYKVPLMRQLVTMYQHLPIAIRGLPRAAQGFSPNQVGGTLTLFIPLTMTLLMHVSQHRRGSWQWILTASSLLLTLGTMATTLILTQSRWAYISTLITLLLLGLSQRDWLRWFTLGVFLLGIGIVILLGPVNVAHGLGLHGVSSPNTLLNYGSLSGRAEIWQQAITVIQDHPLTGIGFDTLVPIVHARYNTFRLTPDRNFAHAHNFYLQVALDLGLPGLMAFVAMLLLWFYMLWQVRWHAASTSDRALTTGLLFGTFAQLLYGFVDAIALGQKPGIFLWLYLGLGGALWLRWQETTDDS
ncbi:MAG: O-antigen ligase family protein [Chloroflexota bacterium]|nr:O-antigen ligase family protein [Chloroflexota bacterium]